MPGCSCPVCTSNDPRNQRLRTSCLIQTTNGGNILIDTTTDMRQQVLRAKVPHLDGVLYTHSHADHVLGFDDLRSFNFAQHRAIPIYASKTTIEDIKRLFWFVFNPSSTYQGGMVTQVILKEIQPNQPIDICGLRIFPLHLMHGKTPVLGFKCGKFAYATDCNFIPPETMEMMQGLDLLVLDALRYEPHQSHFTIPQAIEVAQEIGARRTLFTHMTHSVDFETVSAKLPQGIELAVDQASFDIEGQAGA